MSSDRTVEITPSASALIESLRGLGYTPETAIADLIDNSIAAQATQVTVDISWNNGSPTVSVCDDGTGMSEQDLANAMRLGGIGPQASRSEFDLGRFGLGLKTASLSQCRRMTMASRQSGITSLIELDVDTIAKSGWVATIPKEIPDTGASGNFRALETGTIVLWQIMDAISGLVGLDKDTFYLRIEDIRASLAMIFHRFLDGDARKVSLLVNGRTVRAWDPFARSHPATIALRTETIRHDGSTLSVKPYVLPHRDRFQNESQYEAAGGPGGWAARQGFYVYRGKRLLVAGSWLGLGGTRAWTREESSRLARIAIDLPTAMDSEWRIDVRKSRAHPPGALRSRLAAIGLRSRNQAREVFAFRGKGPRTAAEGTSANPVWNRHEMQNGTDYRINRRHPAIVAYLQRHEGQQDALEALFTLIEKTVPVERIWLDISDSDGLPSTSLTDDEQASLLDQLVALAANFPDTVTIEERVNALFEGFPSDLAGLREKLIERLEGTR